MIPSFPAVEWLLLCSHTGSYTTERETEREIARDGSGEVVSGEL